MTSRAGTKKNKPNDVTQETEVIEELTVESDSVDDNKKKDVTVNDTPVGEINVDSGNFTSSTNSEDLAAGSGIEDHASPRQDVSSSTVADNLNKQHKNKSRNHRLRSKEDILSFENLRKEHDMVLSFRSVSLMILAIVLCIPWPASFIPLKFLFFLVLSYTAIYNEVMIGDEYAVRQDKSSKWAHVLSYVALGIVALLFVISAVQVGSEVTNLSNALDQANAHLRAAGLTDQMVIGK